MSQRFVYEDAQYGWAVILGDQVARLGDYGGYSLKAYAGDIGQSTFVIDDPNANVGHNGDAILGLQNFYVLELDCPTVGSNGVYGQRLYTGFTREREYRRGDSGRPSLIVGASRQIGVTLEDLNARLSFRILQGADAKRPAETDVARITWLLAHPALSNVYNDAGWFDTSNPVNMDANDYSGESPAGILHDCAVKSGKNYWVGFWEATSKACLWYGDSNTSTTYTSPLQISNVLADIDNVTTFAPEPDATLNRNPARTFAGLYYTHDGGSGYVYNPTTASNYAYRDGTISNANNHTAATALAEANRELTDSSTEADSISCRVKLPSSKATGIKKGQRVRCKFSHLPGYEFWTWMRVNSLQVAQDEPTDQRYTLGLDLTPQEPTLQTQHFLIAYGATIGGLPLDLSAHAWTVAYANGNIADPAQFPGPGGGGMCLWYRSIVSGESADVLKARATVQGSAFWVYEVAGVVPSTISVVSGSDTLVGSGPTATIDATSTADSVLFGGESFQWVAYGTNGYMTPEVGCTQLVEADRTNVAGQNPNDPGYPNMSPPFNWIGYATGTGALSIGGTLRAELFDRYGRGYAALLMRQSGFSVIQSAYAGSGIGGDFTVTLPAPPTP